TGVQTCALPILDTQVWNPQNDPLIETCYGVGNLKTRSKNKHVLGQQFGLDQDSSPLFCVISRLTWQKGIDLLVEVTDEIVAQGGRLAVLGSGDAALEGAFHAAAVRHPGRVAISTGYNEPLSHRMQAGADAIIIPSRFEPCGLTQ